MDFDTIIDRRGSYAMKWDLMEARYGVAPDTGIPMWVADMDFRPPACVQAALTAMADPGVYGYYGGDSAYLDAIRWWMANRHGWDVAPEAIFSTHGLVNGTALCVDTWTQPGDAVILFTPVYHAFARVITSNGREVRECPLAVDDTGRQSMDLDAAEALLQGNERMVILCSPHNPGGRVWTTDELRALADFAKAHDLIVVSDEIHHDLVFPGARHVPMALAAPEISDRLVMLTAASKTFNIAGAHLGNVIIPDATLRKPFAQRMAALGISPNSFGLHMVAAAYSAEGAEWLDALIPYLDENRRLFDEGVNAIPGLRSVPLEATYLAWVDFSGTGMTPAEFTRRVEQEAKIAVNHGDTFGTGGGPYLRFNFATPRIVVAEAVARLQAAFADLQ
jgi:cystathionine beta-lyase